MQNAQNKHNFYFTIPLDNKNTILYTYSEKYLLKISKNKLDEIIFKFLSGQKCKKKYQPIVKILNLSLKERSIQKKEPSKERNYKKIFNNFNLHKKKLYIIIGENIIIQKDTRKTLPCRLVTTKKCGKDVLQNSSIKLIIELIYNKEVINFLEKNKKLLINNLCCLIGVDEFYIFKLSEFLCANCLRLRRMANRKNLLETILLENYLQKNKIRYLLSNEQLFFILQSVNRYNRKENILIKDTITQEISFHNKIIPFPLCPICKGKVYKEDIQKYGIIDNKIGIINNININKIELDKIKFYISTTKISNIILISRLRLFNKPSINKISELILREKIYTEFSPWRPFICGSVATNKEISEIKALSESMERYCASLYSKKYLLFNSYENLKPKAVSPTKWILFGPDQYQNPLFPYKPFTEYLKTYWVPGFDLETRKEIYLPAPFVFIRYFFDKKEGEIGPYPTTGLACGKNEEDILLSGICENIERDACMLTWLLKIPPKKITDIDDEQIRNILKSFKISGINLRLFEISLDIKIPTVLVFGVNNNRRGPKIFIGSACKPVLKDAILRAIDELAQGFNWHYLMNKYKNYNFGKKFKNITQFEHHALFYSRLKDLSILNFILETKRILNYRNFQTRIITYEDVVNSLYKLGYNILYTDLTTLDVNSIGFKVYKILIPGLQPLNSNHNTTFLDQKRIKRIMDYLDFKKIEYSKRVNLYPHPFT